jgi:two-component system NtrC family sensor kinase
MEAQIQAAQVHMIQAARMATIGEVAAGVAHQIYNPLTTIIADAQILLRNLQPGQVGRESAEAIEQAGWRLQQVVERLMEFSRPPSEHLERLSVTATIQAAVSLVGASIETAGFRLIVELEDNIPFVMGNHRQLEGLWVNLLLLAKDAVENNEGQTIQITSRRGPKNAAIVEVCDDGYPIPLEQLEGIFEPNFIGPQSGRGTGIEYSICREIVRQHNGHITAESSAESPFHRTVFRVSLPGEG